MLYIIVHFLYFHSFQSSFYFTLARLTEQRATTESSDVFHFVTAGTPMDWYSLAVSKVK